MAEHNLISHATEDLVGLVGNITRWYISPYVVFEGEKTAIPESVSKPEDTFNMVQSWSEVRTETYMPEPFLPLLSSYYRLGGGFYGEGEFSRLLEDVYEAILSDLSDKLEEQEDYTQQEWVECYDLESWEFLERLRECYPLIKDIGWTFSYEVKDNHLHFYYWLGDCSVEETTNTYKGDTESLFTSEELGQFSSSPGSLEELDKGIFPYELDSVEDLSPRVLVYSLGYHLQQYFKDSMGDFYWADNKTQGLMNFLVLSDTDNFEALSWGDLEGVEVVDKWLETATSL